MMRGLCALLMLLVSSPSFAASLLWDSQSTAGPLTIERSPSPTGPFTMVATVPQGTTSFILTPGAWGHYRVRNAAGPSNTAQYSSDLYSLGVIDRLDAVEARVAALETPVVVQPPPAPVSSNLTSRVIDADHLEIVGTGCVSLRTTGTGLRRIVECTH
jgi:hypothetical protein